MPTALVTGASRGLGASYARCLSARGWKLVLVARDADRLKAVAESLSTPVETVVADLVRREDLERVASLLASSTDIELLVNNAGFGTTATFPDGDPERQLKMVRLHVEAPMRLTRAVLPGMLERGRGAVVQVSSIAAFLPAAGLVAYSSTKRFLVTFSEALHAEVVGKGVRVQALCPGFMHTEFHNTEDYRNFQRDRVPGWMWMAPEEVARYSLEALDSPHSPLLVIPGWPNRLLVGLMGNPLMRKLVRALRPRPAR